MPVRSLILPVLAAIVVGGVALSLGHSAGTAAPTRAPATVAPAKAVKLTIANYAFHPPALTVRAGTVVTVTNVDSTAHTATARSGAFDSGTLQHGQTARITLKKPGTYAFYCQFHAFMTGTIKVVP